MSVPKIALNMFDAISDEDIEANKGKTYQDVTAMADPMAGLFGNESGSSDEGEDRGPFETQDGGKGSGNFGHSGRPGMVGGSGSGGSKNDLQSSELDGTIKSLRIKTPDGRMTGLVPGTGVTKVKVIAGQGHKDPIHDKGLPRRHPGASGFSKMRGEAIVDNNGVPSRAEVHWYESRETGIVEMKVKGWLDD